MLKLATLLLLGYVCLQAARRLGLDRITSRWRGGDGNERRSFGSSRFGGNERGRDIVDADFQDVDAEER